MGRYIKYNFLSEKLKGRNRFQNLNVDGRAYTKSVVQLRCNFVDGLSASSYGSVVRSCEFVMTFGILSLWETCSLDIKALVYIAELVIETVIGSRK